MWDVVLFHPAGYDARIASAASFLSGYLSNQEPQLLEAFRHDGGSDTLRGLYELVSAVHNPPDRQQP